MSKTGAQSRLHFYSLGKAAENKALDTHSLMVVPIEHLMLLDGELATDPVEVEREGVDSQGQHYTTQAMTDRAVRCDWLPMSGGYQATSPDIRRDERVLIWRMADSNSFYWTPLGLDNNLRKLETLSFMISGTSDESEEELTPDNSYVFSVSTHEGHITMTTSRANEEATVWALQWNTKDGVFVLTEENGNEFTMDGVNNYINLLNADKTHVELDRQDIRVYCENSYSLHAVESISMETKTFTIQCDTLEINANQWIRAEAGDSITMRSGSTMDLETGTLTVQSNTNTFQTPTSTFTGNVNIGGNVGVTGNFTSSGSSASIAGLTISGGALQCDSVVASTSVTAPNLRYT